jgi:hypothetical protein
VRFAFTDKKKSDLLPRTLFTETKMDNAIPSNTMLTFKKRNGKMILN